MVKQVSDLDALAGSALATGDFEMVVDLSDTTMDATGTNKQITQAEKMLGLWRLYPEKLPFHFDGGGSAIAALTTRELIVPYDLVITGWTIVADQSGSISIDLRNETYANYSASIPDSGDTIVASAPIVLSSAIKNTDTTLTGWTTAITGGTILRWYVTSVSTITRLSGVLHHRRTA